MASQRDRRPGGRGGSSPPAARRASDIDGAARPASDAVCGWTTLVVGLALSGFLYWKNHCTYMTFEEFYLVNNAALLWTPLCVILILLRADVATFGMRAGDLRRGAAVALAAFVLFLPVMAFIARTPDAQTYYLGVLLGNRPDGSGAITNLVMIGTTYVGGHIDVDRLLFHEAVFGFYMFSWEWFFRGFLLNGLQRILPVTAVVAIQAILFCALHLGKPPPEVISSLAGGILLGLLALRYRSFLPCFLLHWAISAGFDAEILYFHFHP